MTGNTKSLPDPYLEASSWFMKVEEGLSDLERRQFEAWIAASDAHPEIFAKVCAISSADLADMDAGQQADISVAPVARARTTSYWRNLALPAAAAVVLVAFVSAGLLFQPSSDRATGVEMAAVQMVMDQGFDDLAAPVRRLNGVHTPTPYSPPLEAAVVPSVEQVAVAVRELAAE